MIPLLPLAVIGLGVLAFKNQSARDSTYTATMHGVMTPERTGIYDAAMCYCNDPEKLMALAEEFNRQGLTAHADMLAKRANIRSLPPERKKQRREIFKRAMNSQNGEAVRKVAAAFHQEGCTGAAAELYKHAAALDGQQVLSGAPNTDGLS